MNASGEWVNERTMIPDLLRAAPQTRRVLDRYGLRGCGGPLGPVEPLGFFARAHDVPVGQLVREVRASVSSPEVATPHATEFADTIYRPFFKAGIAVVLTLGAVWGAYLLLRIGISGSFTAVGVHEVNAHGHAQIFGWVGLFVMGFAYQAFPRFKHTTLSDPLLAYASFGLMVAGILARSVSEPLVKVIPGAGAVAVGASGLEVVAVALFVWVIGRTLRGPAAVREPYDYYVLSALGWFVVQAVYETIYLATTVSATDENLVPLVATWQGALRDVQIHGFALLMILGVSQRFFHHFYALPAPSRRVSIAALVCLNAAVLGEAAGLILTRQAGHAWAGLWYGSVLLLAGAVVALVRDWRIFSRSEESDRSLKFLRTAYVWLFVSLAMLVLLPAYQFGILPRAAADSPAVKMGFSHAYYGAIRHAVTVGFISLMIVGVAAKVVPTLNGVDVRSLSPLWVPFVLINAGCALRVGAQTLTDVTPAAFPWAGVSGLLEVTGLAVWGVHLWSVMDGRGRSSHQTEAPRLAPGSPITAKHMVGDVLTRYPELLEVFLKFGFRPLASPQLRRVLARNVSIERACRLTGQDVTTLVGALNRGRRDGRRIELALVSESEPDSRQCIR